MIPELPRWDEVDFVSKSYVGPSTRPPFKREWLHPTYALGPLIYGVDGQHLAQRWWAAYAEVYDGSVFIYVVQAKADGSGWGKPRRMLTFTWVRIVLGLDFGFNTKGEAIMAVHHNDQFGPPNATTVYYMVKDPNHAGAYTLKSEYLIESQGCVIACDIPKFTNGVDRVTYIFFINAAHQLCYVTDNGSGTIDFNAKTVSLQLGPTWEILHGGYRVDEKFQLAYRHDPDDPFPEQIPVAIEYDYFELASSTFDYAEVTTDYFPIPSVQDGSIENITPTAISDTIGAKLTALVSVKVSSPLISELAVEEFTIPALSIASIKLTSPVKVVNPQSETLYSKPTKPKNAILETVVVPVVIQDSEFIGVPIVTSAKLTTL